MDASLDPIFREAVDRGVLEGKKISLITYVLGDAGENKLKYILSAVLNKVGRPDLMELFYTSAKELIVNSTKAAIKRMIFDEMRLNIRNLEDYEKGMKLFKTNLNERKFPAYKQKMKEHGYQVKITCIHTPEKVDIEIRNNFPLIPKEAERIKEKFLNAKKYDNLFEFFMEHGDNTEGAGMGITMVEILLSQSGFDRRLFSIYSSERKRETVARVEVPLGGSVNGNSNIEQLFVE
ncbi:ATP-binding protein [Leptospira idonii]|uniref:ATP-binding protein n=1 Tax=Leptospira idonii TaxID=1193500 RepID=A0A4R9M481_9LEPT|nr:ATP-binding protein [Leptospira idonii]TGN20902.1 ATP-binding protein [Leptospira idonii]